MTLENWSFTSSTKNVNVTNWPSSLLAEPTVTRIVGYVIGPLDTSSPDYVKVGELVVPIREKWYVYRMSFTSRFPDPNDYRNLILRLIMGEFTVMDEVRAYLWGGGFELRRPVELSESQKIELWIRMDPSAWVLDCSLTIEAWIEEMQ